MSTGRAVQASVSLHSTLERLHSPTSCLAAGRPAGTVLGRVVSMQFSVANQLNPRDPALPINSSRLCRSARWALCWATERTLRRRGAGPCWNGWPPTLLGRCACAAAVVPCCCASPGACSGACVGSCLTTSEPPCTSLAHSCTCSQVHLLTRVFASHLWVFPCSILPAGPRGDAVPLPAQGAAAAPHL